MLKDSYSLPRIEDTLDSLHEAIWFSTLDIKLGYWQVKMDDASKPLMALTVGLLGFYKCKACKKSLTYLGHKILDRGIKTGDCKIKVIQE